MILLPVSRKLVDMSTDMSTETMAESLAANVLREMEIRGWTRSRLARECRWEPARITEILKGNLNYRLATVQRLAEVFGVSGASLLLPPVEAPDEKSGNSKNPS